LPLPRRRPALEAAFLGAGLELARTDPAGRRSSEAGGEAGERGDRNQPQWRNDFRSNGAYRHPVERGCGTQARRHPVNGLDRGGMLIAAPHHSRVATMTHLVTEYAAKGGNPWTTTTRLGRSWQGSSWAASPPSETAP